MGQTIKAISEKVVRATDFKEGYKYAYISNTTGLVSEIGYVRLEVLEGIKSYWYKGILTGISERCKPCHNSKFLEVELI